MILSSDRQSHWVHLVVNALESLGGVQYKDKEKAVIRTRYILNQCVKECQDMDKKIRDKISSLKRQVVENSSEWDVLYSNYLEDEMVRRGFLGLKQGPVRS